MSTEQPQPIRWLLTADAVHGNSSIHANMTLCGLDIEPQSEILTAPTASPPEVCDLCRCVLKVAQRLDGVKLLASEVLALEAGRTIHAIRESDGSADAPWLQCKDTDHDVSLILRIDTVNFGTRYFDFDARPLFEAEVCRECFPEKG